MKKRPLKVVMCEPLGFCAGVDRAIQIVEKSLEKFGAPVYVRHEIVHNKFVVESLKNKGAIFVKELDEIPDGDAPVIFSAHGVPASVPAEATRRNLFQLDATCPLVTKVHFEAKRHFKKNLETILIGHAGHPEVLGTMGQLPEGAVLLVETIEDVENLKVDDPDQLAYMSQTTLSVDDTQHMIDALKKRFPNIHGPGKDDVCYATTNRQEAVKAIVGQIDSLIVVGAPHSSNSRRLVEIADREGCKSSALVERAAEIDWAMFDGVNVMGLTAGASAPDVLIEEIVDAMRARFEVTIETVITAKETITFNLPKELREPKTRKAPLSA
ncbi:MAG: 4-hydroxy-3-methylbut-2-enyl diphosphate reductase [Alphaproteobacteria bacterium]|nr:4-hydroxy-3-methylbut-2-enyl diphosphate reductase [Alphaproteobacteria bacterium]